MHWLQLGASALAFAAGTWLVLAAVASSIRTVILPRGLPSRIARAVLGGLRQVYELRLVRSSSYERRDAVLASYGPSSLLALLLAWLLLILSGYVAIYWALGHTLYESLQLSGSSIATLGFAGPKDLATTLAVVSESLIGLIELALLITYLPTLYSAFQRREIQVTLLEVRAGSPPTGVEMLLRFHRLHTLAHLSTEVWEQWELWFVEVEESHTSLPSLNFFRSPQPHRSWVTAAGAVLDAAALYASVLEGPRDAHADLCIRAGYLALREIAKFFRIEFDPAPARGQPISIARQEFDAAVDRLAEAGLSVRPDRDAAWDDFAGWRVNYDAVLLAVAQLVSAPYAPWSSDRGVMKPDPVVASPAAF